MKPFLKWVGNKFHIIDSIKGVLPPGNRLIEPFVGSGAVFMNTDYPSYLLGDSNRDLVEMYQYIKNEKEYFIEYCQSFFTENTNKKNAYYILRDEFNRTDDKRKRAALFLYLNRHSYNGLIRYNKKGIFNAPFGLYKRPYFPEKELREFIRKSERADIQVASFEDTLAQAKQGDVVYCDPPYVPLSKTSNFTTYHTGGFWKEDHLKLITMIKDLSDRGIPVLVSNNTSGFVQEHYQKAQIVQVEVNRKINCKADGRDKVKEILALFAY